MCFSETLPEELKSGLSAKIKMNSLLRDLKPSNIEDTLLQFRDCFDISDRSSISSIARSIKQALLIHPQVTVAYSYFVSSLYNLLSHENKEFLLYKLRNFVFNSILEHENISSALFLGILVFQKLFSEQVGFEILEGIESVTCRFYYLIAAGEKLEASDYNRFSQLFSILENDATIKGMNNIIEQFKQACYNNWELSKTRLQLNPPPDCLESIIHQDLIDEFMKLVSDPTFNVNQLYTISLWEPAPYLMFESMTLIFAAAFYGAIKIFKFLYINKARLTVLREIEQKSIVSLAVAGGNVEILRLLVQAKVGFDISIHCAAEFDQYDAFVWLDQTIFQDLGILDAQNRTLFHSAAASNSIDIALYILDKTFEDINRRDISGISPIYRAALNGSLEIMQIYLHVPGFTLLSGEYYERSLIHVAAINNDVEMTDILMNTPGIDLNALEHFNMATPLTLSVAHNSFEVLKMLLNVADPTIRDGAGNTLVHTAAVNNRLDILKYLVEEKRFDVNSKNLEGDTPLCLAIDQGLLDIVRFMVTIPDLRINETGKNGNTPLVIAIMRHNPEMVKIIASQPGIDINRPDSIGSSPLCLSVIFNDIKSIKILCQSPNLDLNSLTRSNMTALDLAKSSKIKEILINYKNRFNVSEN